MLRSSLQALITDLHERGFDKDVSVVIWSEFGRAPTINKDAGRDHWPRVSGAVLAGGGMKTGQVIGATDRLGCEPNERPVTFGEVFATLSGEKPGLQPTRQFTNPIRIDRERNLIRHTCSWRAWEASTTRNKPKS